eukprot:scaffold17848_cov19-Prasinocladus_malaysianus.AAC.1
MSAGCIIGILASCLVCRIFGDCGVPKLTDRMLHQFKNQPVGRSLSLYEAPDGALHNHAAIDYYAVGTKPNIKGLQWPSHHILLNTFTEVLVC